MEKVLLGIKSQSNGIAELAAGKSTVGPS